MSDKERRTLSLMADVGSNADGPCPRSTTELMKIEMP